MNLQQVKEQLNMSSLELNTANDIEGNPTEWVRHWDNNRRIAVSIHKDLVKEIKEDSNLQGLGLQEEMRNGEQGDYMSYRIVKYKPAEITL